MLTPCQHIRPLQQPTTRLVTASFLCLSINRAVARSTRTRPNPEYLLELNSLSAKLLLWYKQRETIDEISEIPTHFDSIYFRRFPSSARPTPCCLLFADGLWLGTKSPFCNANMKTSTASALALIASLLSTFPAMIWWPSIRCRAFLIVSGPQLWLSFCCGVS